MKNNVWISSASAVLFALSSLTAAAGAAGSQKAVQSESAATYLVTFQNGLPANYETVIQQAGGRVSLAIPELGAVEAVSVSPSFLKSLAMDKSITAANKELKHSLGYKSIDPAAVDGQPVADIPQPSDIDSYWSFQWDMQQLTSNGASYTIETEGTHTGSTVQHKAVVGVSVYNDELFPPYRGVFLPTI